MTNNTNSTLPVQSGVLGYIIAPVAIITTMLNMFIFIVGLKVLRKKAHNMFVIVMCGGDCLHGISLFLLALLNKTEQTHETFSDMCLCQIIVYFLSISFTLTVSLLICVERYITVRLYNFGTLMQSEGWMKKLAATLLPFSTVYVIICILTVPKHTNESSTCYFVNYYDSFYYRVVMALIAGLFLCLVLAIITTYTLIVFTLLKYIANDRKVLPSGTGNLQNTFQNRPTNAFQGENCPETDQIQKRTSLCLTDLDSHGCSTENGQSIVTLSEVEISTISYRGPDSPTKERTIVEASENHLTWRQWERRALFTCVFIIGSMLLLLCPLILCIVADAFGYNVPKSVGSISAILVTFRSIIDPFLYVFRFEEIRKAIKGKFCSKKNGTSKVNRTRTHDESSS